MAREAKGWEALCLAAAAERDPEKLQQIIVDLNVLLETRQEELEKKAAINLGQPSQKSARWH
jgi:hypothetical protein